MVTSDLDYHVWFKSCASFNNYVSKYAYVILEHVGLSTATRGGQTFHVGCSGGHDDVDEEMDVREPDIIFKYQHRVVLAVCYVLPYVVVRHEASYLTIGQWPPVIGLRKFWEHFDIILEEVFIVDQLSINSRD